MPGAVRACAACPRCLCFAPHDSHMACRPCTHDGRRPVGQRGIGATAGRDRQHPAARVRPGAGRVRRRDGHAISRQRSNVRSPGAPVRDGRHRQRLGNPAHDRRRSRSHAAPRRACHAGGRVCALETIPCGHSASRSVQESLHLRGKPLGVAADRDRANARRRSSQAVTPGWSAGSRDRAP